MGDRSNDLVAEIRALRAELDAVKRLGASRWGPRGWTDFTSSLVWSSSGTQPVLGNGVKEAQYLLLAENLCIYEGAFFFGSTTTGGTGNYLVNLPFNAHQSGIVGTLTPWVGGAKFYSGTIDVPGVMQIWSATAVNFPMADDTAGGAPALWSATFPTGVTGGAGRNMTWTIAYRTV